MKHETMPEVVVKLMAGRERIAKGWCQGAFLLDIPDSLGGPRYCTVGAVENDNHAFACLKAALPAPGFVTGYNDAKGRTKAEILALFDRAIALALAAPQ